MNQNARWNSETNNKFHYRLCLGAPLSTSLSALLGLLGPCIRHWFMDRWIFYFVRCPYAILHKLREIRDMSVGPSATQRRDEWISVGFVDQHYIEWKHNIGYVGMIYRARNTVRCRDLKIIVLWNTTPWWLVICYVLDALPASTFRVVLNVTGVSEELVPPSSGQ